MRKILSLIIVLLIISVLLSACSSSNESKTYDSFSLSQELPVYASEAKYMVDIHKPEAIVGWGDYVFVAKIEKELRTEYKASAGLPRTYYSITVIENLKGKLQTDQPIEFFKHGGVNRDGKSISLLEGDSLLEPGKYYLLVAASETDGSLGQGLPNASILLDFDNTDQLSSSPIIEEYEKYIENETKCDRERYKSIYEAE